MSKIVNKKEVEFFTQIKQQAAQYKNKIIFGLAGVGVGVLSIIGSVMIAFKFKSSKKSEQPETKKVDKIPETTGLPKKESDQPEKLTKEEADRLAKKEAELGLNSIKPSEEQTANFAELAAKRKARLKTIEAKKKDEKLTKEDSSTDKKSDQPEINHKKKVSFKEREYVNITKINRKSTTIEDPIKNLFEKNKQVVTKIVNNQEKEIRVPTVAKTVLFQDEPEGLYMSCNLDRFKAFYDIKYTRPSENKKKITFSYEQLKVKNGDNVDPVYSNGPERIIEQEKQNKVKVRGLSEKQDLSKIKASIEEGTKGVNDAIDNNGNTALHLASLKGDLEMVEWLVGQGANINAVNKDNQNALYNSVMQERNEIFNFLLEKNIEINKDQFLLNDVVVRNFISMTVLNDKFGLLDQILDCPMTTKIPKIVCTSKDIESYKDILTRNLPLLLAEGIRQGKINEIKTLLEKYKIYEFNDLPKKLGDLRQGPIDDIGNIESDMIYSALQSEHRETILKSLIDNGIDINAKINYTDIDFPIFSGRYQGGTILHRVAASGDLKSVELLLINGATKDSQAKCTDCYKYPYILEQGYCDGTAFDIANNLHPSNQELIELLE